MQCTGGEVAQLWGVLNGVGTPALDCAHCSTTAGLPAWLEVQPGRGNVVPDHSEVGQPCLLVSSPNGVTVFSSVLIQPLF